MTPPVLSWRNSRMWCMLPAALAGHTISRMVFVDLTHPVTMKRAGRALLTLGCALYALACAGAPSPGSRESARPDLDIHGYWQAEDRPDLMVGIEEDRLISSVGGSLSEVSGI